MTEFLANKTIIVTGGSSGMGYATVVKLLELGATVHNIDIQPLAKGHAPYPTTGKLYNHIGVDISSREQVHQTFDEIFKLTPDVYGLANVAGITPIDKGLPTIPSDETYMKTINVNVHGAWFCTTEFLRRITANKEPVSDDQGITLDRQIASIVMVGSSAAVVGFAGVPHYCGAKSAVLGFTRAWAREFGPYGVRVNAMCLGATLSAPAIEVMQSTSKELADLRPTLEAQRVAAPLRRMAVPAEMADPILFFLSEKSSFVTGQYLLVNGGWC